MFPGPSGRTVLHRFGGRILRSRGSRWKGNSHERTPIAGLMGAHGVLDGPVRELRRVRTEARPAGAGGAQRAVRDGRDGELAGEQPGRAVAQLALERAGVVRARSGATTGSAGRSRKRWTTSTAGAPARSTARRVDPALDAVGRLDQRLEVGVADAVGLVVDDSAVPSASSASTSTTPLTSGPSAEREGERVLAVHGAARAPSRALRSLAAKAATIAEEVGDVLGRQLDLVRRRDRARPRPPPGAGAPARGPRAARARACRARAGRGRPRARPPSRRCGGGSTSGRPRSRSRWKRYGHAA